MRGFTPLSSPGVTAPSGPQTYGTLAAGGPADLFALPEMDFAAYHSYGEPKPADRLSVVSQSFLQRYRKPVMIGEFGTDWRGWNLASDPYLRGFRQGMWGGAMGGSAGSAMSWWWEEIHSLNLYPLYKAMNSILGPTGWGQGTWTNIHELKTVGSG